MNVKVKDVNVITVALYVRLIECIVRPQDINVTVYELSVKIEEVNVIAVALYIRLTEYIVSPQDINVTV